MFVYSMPVWNRGLLSSYLKDFQEDLHTVTHVLPPTHEPDQNLILEK